MLSLEEGEIMCLHDLSGPHWIYELCYYRGEWALHVGLQRRRRAGVFAKVFWQWTVMLVCEVVSVFSVEFTLSTDHTVHSISIYLYQSATAFKPGGFNVSQGCSQRGGQGGSTPKTWLTTSETEGSRFFFLRVINQCKTFRKRRTDWQLWD